MATLTPHQQNQIDQYCQLLTEANQRVNLVSRKDISHLSDHHIIPCLAYLRLERLHDNETIVDIGSGGGLPGIVNAIVFPTSQFVLIDSIKKKTDCLSDIVQQLGLNNVVVIHDRVENLKTDRRYKNGCDHVTARAVAPLRELWYWSKPLLKPNGTLEAMKGGVIETQLADLPAQTHATVLPDTISGIVVVSVHG